MTTRIFNGLAFHIHSPSLFELANESISRDLDDGARVFLEFNGFKWWLRYCIPNRVPISRMFASRDAAVSLIASRRTDAELQIGGGKP